MESSLLTEWLTEGLDPAEAAVVKKAIERDTVKTKAAGYKAQAEFDTIIAERTALQEELEGNAAEKKVGSREYRKWYEKNAAAAIENDAKIREFDTKHGAGSFAKALAGELPAGPVVAGQPISEAQVQALIDSKIAAGVKPAVAEAEIQRMVDARIQGAYAPKWSELLTDTGNIVQKHMFAKRSAPIDFKKVSEIAQSKNIPLEAAYDEWDKPERDKATTAATEAEIDRRVNEAILKRGAAEVPAGADATPGALSAAKAPTDKFDRGALLREMQVDLAKIQ